MVTIINLEGNIGVGKTTLKNILKTHNIPNCSFVDEPFYEQKELFDDYYKDMKRWAMTFQIYIRESRYFNFTDKLYDCYEYIIMDRSLGSDKNVFAKMLHDDGIMTDIEWLTYNMSDKCIVQEDSKTIYLTCSPEVALKRMHKRNRPQEQNITLEYLTKVKNYYDSYISSLNDVLIIDCNNDFENNNKIIENVINFILNKN
jgi:deoxyadenosine/deoxycytidine kinase